MLAADDGPSESASNSIEMAFSVKIREQVSQLNRTNDGNPTTGCANSDINFFVSGSAGYPVPSDLISDLDLKNAASGAGLSVIACSLSSFPALSSKLGRKPKKSFEIACIVSSRMTLATILAALTTGKSESALGHTLNSIPPLDVPKIDSNR
uniref:Uncharacterized protein n=1 Tax=Polytomella parva TaxID=51329 RepID=A0A7S0UVP5_9CHLO